MGSTILGFVSGAVGALVTWLLTEFVGRPFRHFFDLRTEISRRLVQYDNVFARAKMTENGLREPVELSEEEDSRLTKAQDTFRDLASQLRAFALGEPFAGWIVGRVFGYDAFEASGALIGLSNEISTSGPRRHHFKTRIEQLLHIQSN